MAAAYEVDRKKIMARLARIEGQVRGVERMLESDQYCVDILTQLSSIIAATQKVSLIVLNDHIKGCVRRAVTTDQQADEHVEELLAVVGRFMKA